MRRSRRQEPKKDNSDRWLLTYSDLITLLMIFFVVLYSMSKVDADKFRAVAESLNRSLGSGQEVSINTGKSILAATIPTAADTQANTPDAAQELISIESIKNKIDKFAQDNGIEAKLVTSIEERGLVVSIQDTLLFESGSAAVTVQARAILEKIAIVLQTTTNYIRVEGHTDDLPITTTQFPSNWELSSARATNVLKLMITGGVAPHRLSETGYGEYRPLVPNNSEVNRAQNRRIDLIILRSKYDVVEPGKVPGY